MRDPLFSQNSIFVRIDFVLRDLLFSSVLRKNLLLPSSECFMEIVLIFFFPVSVVSVVTSWNFFFIWSGQKWTSTPLGQDFCAVGLQTFPTCSTVLDPGSYLNFTPIGGPVTHLDFSVTSGSSTDVSTKHSEAWSVIFRLTAPSLFFLLIAHSWFW